MADYTVDEVQYVCAVDITVGRFGKDYNCYYSIARRKQRDQQKDETVQYCTVKKEPEGRVLIDVMLRFAGTILVDMPFNERFIGRVWDMSSKE